MEKEKGIRRLCDIIYLYNDLFIIFLTGMLITSLESVRAKFEHGLKIGNY